MRRSLFLLIALGALLAAPSAASAADPYDVDIRGTERGIPHLLARDFGSLGYGYG